MSSRSNSSNQSKVTHLPLQKRVFNAPLAAVIAMGCVTGIAGGIAATSAHPMQAAYAASSTTQGVFTLDRAAEGMDRSAEAEVPSNTAPGFLFSDVDFKDNNMSFTWRSFTDDSFIGDIIKPALKLYYGSACTIQTPDYEKGIIAVEVNGKIHKHTFASFVYREVPLKVPDESKIISGESPSDPAILSQIKKNVIEANPDLHIKEDELTLEKYTNINKSTLVDVIAYRSNKEKVNCDASNHQYVYTGGLIGLKHLFKGKEVAPAPAPLTLATTELEEGQKVEVADPAKPEDFTSEQLGAIKDALNKVNAKVDNKDAVSDVKYEASKLVAVLSDNTTKVDLDASKLTKKKVVAVELVMPSEKLPVKDFTRVEANECDALKAALIQANSSANVTAVSFDNMQGFLTVSYANGQTKKLYCADVFYHALASWAPETKIQLSSVATPSQADKTKLEDAIKEHYGSGTYHFTYTQDSVSFTKAEFDLNNHEGEARASLKLADIAQEVSAPAPLTLATTELEEGQKVEVADPAKPEDFTSEQLGAIKDALNKVNAKVGNKDAVSDVKYEASKLVAVLSDNATKVDLDAAKLTKKKTVSELKTLTVADPELTEVANLTNLSDTDVAAVKKAIKDKNTTLDLTDEEIAVEKTTGKVTITRAGFKPVVLEANKVVKQKPAELQTLNVADPAVTEVVNTAQIQDDEVTKIKTAIKAVNQSLNLQDSEITVEKTTGKVTITRAGFKPVVLEANKVVTKKVVTPIEPPAPEPPAKESPREILKRTNPAMFVEQSRYAGKTALDTMAKIVEQAFPSAENVVLATQYGYWDALSANALAGSLNAPIMLSDFDSLPEQTVAQLKRLQAKTVYICGGTHVISKQVEQQLHQLGMRVVRYAGSEASDTATKIALNTETVSDTCFITTSWGYGDSMSVSSYSYAKHAPIFLTNMNGDIDDSTLDAIRAKGFKHIVLVGGTSVISAEVEDLVRSLGVSVERVWGETQYDTSLAFAKWATQDSKEPLTIGISTGYGFTDALCGAALTGKAGGVMVLADDSMTKQAFSAFKDFVGTHAKQIEDLQIFGGTSVVGMGVTQALTSEFKEAYQNDNASAAPEGTSTPTQPQGTAGQTQPPLRREN